MIDAAFVQVLVGLDLVAVLVSDPDQQEPPLSTIDRDLPDNLIETLIVQLFPGRTEAYLPGLAMN